MLKAVLFDFDGTLVDTISLIVDSFQYVYQKYWGKKKARADILSGIGLPLEEVFAQDFPGRDQEILKDYLEYSDTITQTSYAIYIGIGQMLEEMQAANIPMAIVTAKRLDNVESILEVSGIEHYFQHLVTKFDTKEHKPNPAPLLLGLAKFKEEYKPSEVLYVGDSIYDLKAAHNGGFPCAAVAWSSMPHSDLRAEKPTYWLERPGDLINLFK